MKFTVTGGKFAKMVGATSSGRLSRRTVTVPSSCDSRSELVAHFCGSCEGNWTTRGLPTRGLDKSRTGQLAVSQMPPNRKTKHAESPIASASCPVTVVRSASVIIVNAAVGAYCSLVSEECLDPPALGDRSKSLSDR